MKTKKKPTKTSVIVISCLLLTLAPAACIPPDGQTATILEPAPSFALERVPAIPVEELATDPPATQGSAAANIVTEVRGLPVRAPAPYETHAGDLQYFYLYGDDYVVYKFDLKEGMNVLWRDYDVSAYGEATQYVAVFFRYFKARDTEAADYFTKRVFENEEYARRFAADRPEWELVAIGNAVYDMYPPLEWETEGRENVMREINDIDDVETIYVSKP